jgi:hypothetical protein
MVETCALPGLASLLVDTHPLPTREIKNDYAQQFVDTGARPQNYLRDSVITDR